MEHSFSVLQVTDGQKALCFMCFWWTPCLPQTFPCSFFLCGTGVAKTCVCIYTRPHMLPLQKYALIAFHSEWKVWTFPILLYKLEEALPKQCRSRLNWSGSLIHFEPLLAQEHHWRVLTSGLLLISSFFPPTFILRCPRPLKYVTFSTYLQAEIQGGALYIKYVYLKIVLIFATHI